MNETNIKTIRFPSGVKISPNQVTDLLFKESIGISTATIIDFSTEKFIPNFIEMITNDGETDILVSFYLNSENVESCTSIKLKGGESIGGWDMAPNTLKIEPNTSGEVISWRLIACLKE